ncbi:MAG TPA: hypothetical protein VGK73_37545 [Polyangiaceae bacterium]
MPARSTAPNALRELIGAILGLALPIVALLYVTGPMLADFSTYGFHDWDVETAYRYITVASLAHGEGPWWHPWLCGGVPAWGYVEGASNFVSPYLPLYLLADVRTAIRLELLGQGLLGIVGCWCFAGCFTRSAALRSLLATLFVLNGRWALQAAVGHTWHLQYALMPWAFFFFERALARDNARLAIGSGIAMALACYWGGIYPLPHTALLLSVYALLRAALERRLLPLVALVVAGGVALGVSAPKLFAVLDHMQAVPRLIQSKEVIGFSELMVMLLAPDQRYGQRPVKVPAYNWHEWGIYVGPIGLFVLAAGVFFGKDRRALAFKILGVLCLLLGFGAFHRFAPWALLHELPIFASQHVPSRFHYPMLLMLGAAFVASSAALFETWKKRWAWLDLALLVPVAALAWDMARFSRTPFEQAFWMRAPERIERAMPFEHRERSPVAYIQPDWAEPMLLAMFANTGVTRCYGVDPKFKPAAVPAGVRGYRGRAHVELENGALEDPRTTRAVVWDWTPNRAVIQITGARPGALVVYNMNYDPSWRVNGEPALNHRGLVAGRATQSDERLEFSYYPRSLTWSLPLCLLTLMACFVRGSHLQRVRGIVKGRGK